MIRFEALIEVVPRAAPLRERSAFALYLSDAKTLRFARACSGRGWAGLLAPRAHGLRCPAMSDRRKTIEVYEWRKGDPPPSLMGSDGVLGLLETPPTGGPNIGDTIMLPGSVVGDREALGVPYRVLDRIFLWGAEEPDGQIQKWTKMWIYVRRIEWEEQPST